MKSLFVIASLALAQASCSLLFESESNPDGGDVIADDAGADARLRDLILTANYYDLDTDNGTLTSSNGTVVELDSFLAEEMDSDGETFMIRRVLLKSLRIGTDTTLHATGFWGLELSVLGPVNVDGDINVSSDRGQERGPGSDFGDCTTPPLAEESAVGGSGGAGGAFAGNGGVGGQGIDAGVTPSATEHTGRSALRGGCPGGNGGVRISDMGMGRASGGSGGGALRIVSQTNISFEDSTVRASGAGGEGGALGLHGGGGGGGSGGMIWLKAPVIILNDSTIRANGGGGGEGSSGCLAGLPGQDGRTSQMGDPAKGGGTEDLTEACGSDEAGGDAGDGSAGTSNATGGNGFEAPGSLSGNGGGGGGGSAGFIFIESPISPQIGGTSGIEPAPILLGE